jgi:hypothetical protein
MKGAMPSNNALQITLHHSARQCPTTDELDANLNFDHCHYQFRTQMADAFLRRDAGGFVFAAGDNTKELALVADNAYQLIAAGMYEQCLVHAWTGTRTNHRRWPWMHLLTLIAMADRAKLLASGQALPSGDKFVLYRGVAGKRSDRRTRGFSWTDDADRAAWFAKRFNLESPAVYQMTVQRKEVYFYDNSREESEFVIWPTGRLHRLGLLSDK